VRLHRHPLFLHSYGLLPHRALNAAVARLARARTPQPAVQAAIRYWVQRGGIDLGECEPGPWPTVEAFFLRDLKSGARMFEPGLSSPCDGIVVSTGTLHNGQTLVVKGKAVSLDRLVNGRGARQRLDLAEFDGGRQVTVFLTPDGYHHVHAPCDAEWHDVRWLPGRFFPQNDEALAVIPGVYERNERAVLRFQTAAGPLLLVMVGASLVGGIHLDGMAQRDWQRREATSTQRRVHKGERLGHFAFGSTVVLLAARGVLDEPGVRGGEPVKLGATLAALLPSEPATPGPRPC
jgi:phosphatidylserine decarboxylase